MNDDDDDGDADREVMLVIADGQLWHPGDENWRSTYRFSLS